MTISSDNISNQFKNKIDLRQKRVTNSSIGDSSNLRRKQFSSETLIQIQTMPPIKLILQVDKYGLLPNRISMMMICLFGNY